MIDKSEAIKSGKFYVYIHRRNDTNEVFYIGKGIGYRAWCAAGEQRNDYWHRVVKRAGGYSVEIFELFENGDDAYDREEELIDFYWDSGKLTNLSRGGRGPNSVDPERHGMFISPILLYSEEFSIYKICLGNNDMFENGFPPSGVCSVLNGKEGRTTVSSTKIHRDGVRVKFSVMRDELDELQKFLEENNFVEAELSSEQCFGVGSGRKHHNWLGYSVGQNDTSIVILDGQIQMEKYGFRQGAISNAISGRSKTASGYKWIRTKDLQMFKGTHLNPATPETLELLQP